MTTRLTPITMLASVALLLAATNALRAEAPAGASALCKDGTYSSTATKRGACAHHGGVKSWLATADGAKKRVSAARTDSKPDDATGECKDGTFTSATHERGACSRHGGVKQWYSTTRPGAPAASDAEHDAEPDAEHDAAPGFAPTRRTTAHTASEAAPEGASAQCNDGSYSRSAQHRGACSHHGGVKQWLKDIPK